MKLILLLAISCLAVHSGKGAPTNALYKFLRCNPNSDQANCVTQQSPVMAWSQDLPAKLPASAAQYLDAEPVEDESLSGEEEQIKDEEIPVTSGEEVESPHGFLPEEGSGGYEGSASEGPLVADSADGSSGSETGSGVSWIETYMDLYKGGDLRSLMPLLHNRSLAGEAKATEQDLRDDHLLQM